MRIRLVVISLTALAVIAAGCSDDPTASKVHRSAPAEPVRPVDYRDVLMRPQSFFDATEKITDVTVRLTRECMAKKGYRYDGLAQTVDRFQGELEPDMAYRQKEGFGQAHYHRPLYQPTDAEAEKWAHAFRGPNSEGVRYQTLAGSGGTSGGGCFGAAKKRVAGSVQDWFWAVDAEQDYWLIFAAGLPNQQTWRDAVDRWTACMAKAGWPEIGGPDGPQAKAREKYAKESALGQGASDELRQFETDLAVADGQCQIDSGRVDVSRSLRESFLESASPEYRRDLKRIAAARTRALRTIQTSDLD